MKRWIFACMALATGLSVSGCGSPDSKLTKEQRVDEIDWVINKFEHNYAPLEYKQKLWNFNWEQKKAEYREKAAADISNDQLRVLIQDLVGLFQDAHTAPQTMLELRPGVMDVAYLGFTGFRIKEKDQDKLYVKALLPTFKSKPEAYTLKTGDKILKVDGQEIYDFVKAHCPRSLGQDESNKTAFIPRLAVMDSTNCTLPEKADATLTVVRDAKELVLTLPWLKKDYFAFAEEQRRAEATSKEDADDESDNEENVETRLASRLKPWNLDQYAKYLANRMSMAANAVDDFSVKYVSTDMLVAPFSSSDDGCKGDDCEDGEDDNANFVTLPNKSFKTMLVKTEKGNVGYIKIESFSPPSSDAVEHFKKALATLKNFGAKALVIDLVDNGGGSLEYGLELAALLKPSNGSEPFLEVRLNDNWLNSIHSSALFAENDSLQELSQRRYEKLKKESNDGRWLSEKFHLSELSLANQPADQSATKVVLMVNEMCASMCDIFTADLKDNGIATIIGKKTMGAGGNVVQHGLSPRLNYVLSQTESLIVRANGEYIENKGVEPDVKYEPTLTDLKGKNEGFIKAAAKLAMDTYGAQ